MVEPLHPLVAATLSGPGELEPAKYIKFEGQIITVTQSAVDGLWRSDDGTIWAYIDAASMNDPVSACGVGLDLPNWTGWMRKLNEACGPHDFKYSSPAYQAFHTRSEADADLLRDTHEMADGAWWAPIGTAFAWIARKFGGKFWENRSTND